MGQMPFNSTDEEWDALVEKSKLHKCKYCGVETTQPDEKCYAKTNKETLEEAAERLFPFTKNDSENRIITINSFGITINSTASKFDSSYTISIIEI